MAQRRQASAALRVRSDGVMCVAPHVPVIVAPTTTTTTVTTMTVARPRRKKLKWRTRDSQSSQLYNLQLDIQDVQQQIRALSEYRELLAARALNRQDDLDGCYVKTVMEYHRVFERGYHPPEEGAMMLAARPPPQLDARQFLLNMMDDNLRIGRYTGLDVLLDQWVRYTRAQTGLEFRYTGSRVISANGYTIVISRATYSHLVTHDMVETMFPQLLRDHPDIMSKLLGSTVQGEGEYEFTFDARTHRVVHFEFRLDYVEVFSRLLRDVRELDAVFSSARISEESLIGDIDAYHAYRHDLDGHHELQDHHMQYDQQEQQQRIVEAEPQAGLDPDQQQHRNPYSVASLLASTATAEQPRRKRDLFPIDPPAEYR